LKKRRCWTWSQEFQQVFDALEKAIIEKPVLPLPDINNPFELHTDASNFTIVGVLMKEGHLIGFESQKFNDTERWYTIQEKEMTAEIQCLCTCRHDLLESKFIIKTDNAVTIYFQIQKKLTPKQSRW